MLSGRRLLRANTRLKRSRNSTRFGSPVNGSDTLPWVMSVIDPAIR